MWYHVYVWYFLSPVDSVPQDTHECCPWGQSLTLQGVDSLVPVHDSAKGSNEMKTAVFILALAGK